MLDMNKPPEQISLNMTGVLVVYSCLFMRFAWMVKPRNYLLLACHASNTTAQSVQLGRRLESDLVTAPAAAAAAAAGGGGGTAAPTLK